MRLSLAIKAFFKAWREPDKAKQFIEDRAVVKTTETADVSHLRLLQDLQQTGRLIDFLQEDLSGFNDAQVGAAVRKIQEDCKRLLEERVTIRPLKEEAEGSAIQVPKGYNPLEIKVIGKVKGEPPFSGILIHRGWKALKRSLPKQTGEQAVEVLYPAEIEIK